jgi:hypothetical protein
MTPIGLQDITVSLRGVAGAEPTGSSFFDHLGTKPRAEHVLHPSTSGYQSARIALFSVTMAEFAEHPEPAEAFAASLQHRFSTAADWLAGCDPSGLDRWIASGKTADIFIDGLAANEQIDLHLPASFIVQCARLRLSIILCTND